MKTFALIVFWSSLGFSASGSVPVEGSPESITAYSKLKGVLENTLKLKPQPKSLQRKRFDFRDCNLSIDDTSDRSDSIWLTASNRSVFGQFGVVKGAPLELEERAGVVIAGFYTYDCQWNGCSAEVLKSAEVVVSARSLAIRVYTPAVGLDREIVCSLD